MCEYVIDGYYTVRNKGVCPYRQGIKGGRSHMHVGGNESAITWSSD